MNARVWLPVLLITIIACDPKDHGTMPPLATVNITPDRGATIDTFKFDGSLTDPGRVSSKLYYRWDWNRDGIWDGEYSRLPVVSHRYYAKGTYQPIMEVINSDGLTDTVSVKITVEQGYSAPHPAFTISPERGNFKTWFLLDASGSKDDEDSLGQLRFMWDFTGNGSWDTPLGSKPLIGMYYQDTGKFEVILQVADPQNMRKTTTRIVWVTDINPKIIADFTWTPDYGTTSTEFTLDASTTNNPETPQAVFRYSWKLPPDYVWSEWNNQPIKKIAFAREYTYDLELKVMDTASLINYCKKTITVYHQNLPPNPKFVIGCRRGNIRTQFFFNSWPTLDQESLPTTLEVRWDFNGDERWDTEYSKDRTIYHNYPEAGTYKVYMEARDPEGLSDTAAQFVEVSPWTNETGLIYDQRDGQYYGTVKIGNQWWMSQNLNFAPYDSLKDEVKKFCNYRYDMDPVNWCNIMGGLYSGYHATREDWYGEVKGICPTGWHIPSRNEWETLVQYIGGWDQADKLLPGENTDFNALYAGYAESVIQGKQTKVVGRGLNSISYFWSFNKMVDPYAPNSWNITLIKGEKKFYPGWSDMDYYYSVRCLKNAD